MTESFIQQVIKKLREHWADRNVILLVRRFDRVAENLIEEIERCGAKITAVITGSRQIDDSPTMTFRAFRFADECRDLAKIEFDKWIQSPPPHVGEWLDKLDPQRNWIVVAPPGTNQPTFCERSIIGWRDLTTAKIEDKTLIDDLWQRLGIPSPPYKVLPADDPLLLEWSTRLNRGLGTIFATDTTQGYIGDAQGLCWVRTKEEFSRAQKWLAGSTARVRVAEFVPGAPCSVLGMVLKDGVAVFEPIEIITLRDPGNSQLVFCGSSTFWRPGETARSQMREYTRVAGRYLAAQMNYAGLYSVDGILTRSGFLATELNPRHASGLGITEACPSFPISLFNRSVQQRCSGIYDLGYERVESEFCTAITRQPSLSISIPRESKDFSNDASDKYVTSAVQVKGQTQRIRFKERRSSAKILGIEPVPASGIVSTVVASFARMMRFGNLYSFEEDSLAL